VPGRIARVTRIGFEIRIDIDTADGPVIATATRNQFANLNVHVGSPVMVRVAPEADATQFDAERSEVVGAE
jgi:sulfate transport system ATP-binding protein